MQPGKRPVVVIKDKNNSLLIIKLYSGTVVGVTVIGGVEPSVDFNETFNFCAEADLLLLVASICCNTVFAFSDFPLKCFLFFCFLIFISA